MSSRTCGSLKELVVGIDQEKHTHSQQIDEQGISWTSIQTDTSKVHVVIKGVCNNEKTHTSGHLHHEHCLCDPGTQMIELMSLMNETKWDPYWHHLYYNQPHSFFLHLNLLI